MPEPATEQPGPVTAVAFGPDSRTVALVSASGIQLWDIMSWAPHGPLLQTLNEEASGFGSAPYSVAFRPDGGTLAVGYAGAIRLWDLASGQALNPALDTRQYDVPGLRNDVQALAFSRDGRTLVSGTAAWTLQFWDVDVASWRRRAC